MSWKKLTVKHKRKTNYGKSVNVNKQIKIIKRLRVCQKTSLGKKTENLVQIVVTIGGDGNK
jgi:NAD kinase